MIGVQAQRDAVPHVQVARAWVLRGAFWLIVLAASVNVVVAILLATGDPRRAADLRTMYDWCRAWLFEGQSLYSASDASTDYPPLAICCCRRSRWCHGDSWCRFGPPERSC